MPVAEASDSRNGGGVLVTGSSGFIGSHLTRALSRADGVGPVYGLDLLDPAEANGAGFFRADIRRSDELKRIAKALQPQTVFHLAAVAEVVIPFAEFPPLVDTNISGTVNVLKTLKPRLVLSASSSAVYGDAPASGARPSWRAVRPVGIYGMSKAAGEMIGRDWARETSNVFLHFRFGNVVGPFCRGLVPYLVNHALKHPSGSPPAQLRGQGRIQRDYVPVAYLIDLMLAAMRPKWRPGTSEAFNVGTGRITTNGEVARIVQKVLRQRGHELNMVFDNPLLPGESQHVVLDMERTVKKLGVPVPSHRAVVRAIEEGTISHLQAATGKTAR